jgi:hypothetical protein
MYRVSAASQCSYVYSLSKLLSEMTKDVIFD